MRFTKYPGEFIMKTRIKITALSLATALSAIFAAGCDVSEETSGMNGDSVNESTTNISENSEQANSDKAPERQKPDGEPTILIGLDGEPIYTSEITEVRNAADNPASVDDIAADNLDFVALCEGFVYLKESTGNSYNTHDNPEFFDGFSYTGETPENTNEWKRVNVGDKICGLTLKSAQTGFRINDHYDFPEKYFDLTKQFCEFEGEITLTGYLSITPRNLYEPDGGTMEISFVDAALPIMATGLKKDLSGYGNMFTRHVDVNGSLSGYTECENIQFDETMHNTSVYLGGLKAGDIAKVKVKISGLRLRSGGYMTAHLEDIEILSDVIIHADDRI